MTPPTQGRGSPAPILDGRAWAAWCAKAKLTATSQRPDRRLLSFDIFRIGNQLPHAGRGQWKLSRLNTKGRQRGGDGIRQRAADRDDPALACAFGAERIVRRGMRFERYCTHDRVVGR